MSRSVDDLIDVPVVWRNSKRAATIVFAFVAGMWPDVSGALWRALLVLVSVGATAWAFNLGFLFA